ncbi:BamA/TamA family outer membrane protein [Roseivirga sp. BDSF3-8]|uniref:BamA/TamA family outer membrane protein n=1 Tax=Roseivirga sp. BDSF3-8 TaxID=3241598 RepID=UPI003531BA82
MIKRLLLLASFIFLTATSGSAQFLEKTIEFFTIHPNKKKAAQDSTLYPSKIVLAPVVIYSPETSVGLGVGAKYLFKMPGSGDETRTSNMPVSLIYTLENQIVLYSGFEIFSPQEQWMLTGNLQFQIFPRFYYGIGRNTPESNEEKYNYTQILVEPILLKRVAEPPLFLGAGVRYNRISNVEPEPDGLLLSDDFPGATGSTSVGAELAAVYDSRDNLLNAHTGWYLELTHGFYGEVLGGTHEFQLTRLDFRYYKSLRDFSFYKDHSDVLAFQVVTKFTYGGPPLSELAALGSDQIMRGYYNGRYLDRNLISTQVEYRAQLTKRLGAVVFAGVGDVAEDISDFKFTNLRGSVGFGLRLLIDEREDLNIRGDWGFGNRTNNYYLNIAEAF